MQNILQEYISLEQQIEALELKKSQLKPFIIEHMMKIGETSIDMGVGKFVIAKLKKWTFPKKVEEVRKALTEKIDDLKDEIKAVEEKAKSTNEATFEETESLRFTPIKL
jgi:prefoldin subunit 5